MRQTELAYRKVAAEGANLVGLIVALYDTLAGDLKRASEAISRGDIEGRCKESNHAILVLGHLESWIDSGDPALGATLSQFYAYLRGEILRAQSDHSGVRLEALIPLVLDTRAAWQQRSSVALHSAPAAGFAGIADTQVYATGSKRMSIAV